MATLPVLLAFENGDAEEQAFWRRTIENLDQTEDDLDRAKALISKHNALRGTVEAAERYGQKATDALARLDATSGVAQDIREALEDVVAFCIVRGY